jgi:hypothetical protein
MAYPWTPFPWWFNQGELGLELPIHPGGGFGPTPHNLRKRKGR